MPKVLAKTLYRISWGAYVLWGLVSLCWHALFNFRESEIKMRQVKKNYVYVCHVCGVYAYATDLDYVAYCCEHFIGPIMSPYSIFVKVKLKWGNIMFIVHSVDEDGE